MAQKTYKQIEAEANQKFGKGASKEKFEWRRSQQEAAGLDKETKKRGGVAGTYDRNKALVQAAAPLLAGMLIPGSSALIGGITGGLAKGLDREGKGGIGLDLGQAAKGAIAGAGMGQLGGALKAKAGEFLANRAASKVGEAALTGAAPTGPITPQFRAPSMPSALPSAGGGAGMGLPAAGGGAATPIGGQMASAMRAPAAGGMPSFTPSAAGSSASQAIRGMGGAAGGMAPVAPSIGAGVGAAAGGAARTGGMATVKSLLTNPQVLAGATGAVADVMGQRSQQRVAEQQLAQQGEQFQQRFGMEEEELKRRQAQANRLAGLFTPTRSFSNLGMGMANGNR
jgi:hypothetical protein